MLLRSGCKGGERLVTVARKSRKKLSSRNGLRMLAGGSQVSTYKNNMLFSLTFDYKTPKFVNLTKNLMLNIPIFAAHGDASYISFYRHYQPTR